jgi:hypothetical protein
VRRTEPTQQTFASNPLAAEKKLHEIFHTRLSQADLHSDTALVAILAVGMGTSGIDASMMTCAAAKRSSSWTPKLCRQQATVIEKY